MEIFCERFKELKAQNNLTYPQIAAYLALQPRTIKLYASGGAKPDYYGLVMLANLFGVSLDYLVGRSDDPELHMPSNEDRREVASMPKGDGDAKLV